MKLCGFDVGADQPLFLIAGTCVVESEAMTLDTAAALQEALKPHWDPAHPAITEVFAVLIGLYW